MPENSFINDGYAHDSTVRCKITQLEDDDTLRLFDWVMIHDLESGVERFTCAYFSDSTKPRCDESGFLL